MVLPLNPFCSLRVLSESRRSTLVFRHRFGLDLDMHRVDVVEFERAVDAEPAAVIIDVVFDRGPEVASERSSRALTALSMITFTSAENHVARVGYSGFIL